MDGSLARVRKQDFRTPSASPGHGTNVSAPERAAALLGGGLLAAYGISRRSPAGLLAAALGGTVAYWGATGHCSVYSALGLSTAEGPATVRVFRSVTIDRTPEELFEFWRRLENLPKFMKRLESVSDLGGGLSHWVACAPGGETVRWDAEIESERPGEFISWRSLESSQVWNRGSVRFMRAPAGRGAEVQVEMEYRPPAGPLGALVAKLFGTDLEQQADEDLRRFKQLMETSEIATTYGQPSGRPRDAARQEAAGAVRSMTGKSPAAAGLT